MTQRRVAFSPLFLVALMLLSSWGPLATLQSEGTKSGVAEWGSGGSNDTGWMTIDAINADPDNGILAEGDLHLTLAPGAIVDNLTFEVRVNGSNGTWVEQPQLNFVDTQSPIMDWRGYGGFGQQNDFIGPEPHTSRLNPNVDTGASWLVPGDAEVTDLVVEALRPADTYVSFSPLVADVLATAVHPEDGRLYMLFGDVLLQLDATNTPPVIEIADEITGAQTLVVDVANDMVLVSVDDNSTRFRAWSLSDSSELAGPFSIESNVPSSGGQSSSPPQVVTALMADSMGMVWGATDEADLFAASIGVTSNPNSGSDAVTDLIELNGVIYLATDGGGVMRYDLSTSSWLSPWDTQNTLPSDDIVQLEEVNGVLMIAMADAGIVRYNLATSSWLATWTDANWLASNDIHGLAMGGEWLNILAGETLHHYNTTMGAFASSKTLDSLGLIREGLDLLSWPAGGSRAPAQDWVLVGDGGGSFATILPGSTPWHQSTMQLASGPNSATMYDTLELNGVVWVAGDGLVDRFDRNINRWVEPLLTGSTNQALGTDGTSIFVATSDDGLYEFAQNGSQLNHWTTAQNLNSNDVDSLAYDSTNDVLVVGHSESGVTLINVSNSQVSSSWSTGRSDAFANHIRAVAVRSGIAYMASDRGVLRLDIGNDTLLSSWRSTGMDDVAYMPVETDGSMMYLGMFGYGVLVFDRTTGDLTDTWFVSRNGNGISSNEVYSLHIDSQNDIWVGTSDGADRYDGSHWSHINAQGGFNPRDFFSLTSDSTHLYAGTNAGACQYSLSTLTRVDCWNYYSAPTGLPSSWVYSVEMLTPGYLYAGTNYGAGVIDVANDTIIEVWEAGEQTWNGPTYEWDDVIYVGLNGEGVARYDRINDEWLTTWDSSSSNGLVPSNDVTTLIPDRQQHRIWIGGDFGVRLIDLNNQTMEASFAQTGGQDDPGELVIIGDVLYYSEVRAGTSSNDNVYRYDINNFTTLSSLDAGSRINQNGLVYGIGEGPDGMLWIGVTPSGWFGLDAGSIARWDHANDSWASNLDATGTILRVNSVYAGECEPLNVSACHLFASYGEKVHRQFDYNGNLLNEWDDNVMVGPIRSIDLWQGVIHFATMEGIVRYDMYNDTFLTTWTPGNGLQSNSEDTIFDIEIVGDDLWYTTMADSGWQRNSRIFVKNGTTGQWSDWQAGSGNIPQGFGFSMEVCQGVLHVAMARYLGFGTQGGVARYDLSTLQWLSQWNQGSGGAGNTGLADDDALAIACDEQGGIVYIGFDANDVGISRYSYGRGQFISTISESANGILPDQIFPDGLRWHDGVLMASHTDENSGTGGISRISANGGQLGTGVKLDIGTQASSMEIVPNGGTSTEWLIGRPGGDSGYNRVDVLNSTGLQKGIDVLAGLSSGRMLDIAFQNNEVYITSAASSNQNFGSSILHGELLSNGSISWIEAYPFTWDIVNEMLPINNDLWVTTSGGGLWKVDTTTGQASSTPAPLHYQMHGISQKGSDLVIGLMGTTYTAAGVQVYNMTTQSWTDGALLAGLPSNLVRDFALYDNRVWIATYGGIGVWNLSSQAWDDSITTQNGLTSTVVEHIWVESGELMFGTPSGLIRWDVSSASVTATYDRNSGLLGTHVSGMAYAPQTTVTVGGNVVTHPRTLFLSHNGQGQTRPGATAFSLASMQPTQQYQVDMLPSNNVVAVAADWWGVHIATDISPLVHWNASSGQMESGAPSWSFAAWPVRELVSDGTTLLVLNQGGIDFVDVTSPLHAVVRQENILRLTGASISATGIWVATNGDGLYGFGPAPNHLEIERESMRRADPLTATFSGNAWDITDSTHPGQRTALIDPMNSIWTSETSNSAAPGGIPTHQIPLTLSSPVSGAAVWVDSHNLNYTGTWNLTALNSNLASAFELAARRGTLSPDGRDLHIQLLSPLNGSLEVRITYDWIRSESPVELLDLYDRPDDGGGVVIAEWTPSADSSWAAYRIYLQEGNWSTPPTAFELDSRPYDVRVPVWSVTLTEINTVNGQPIVDGIDLYGVAVIEYADGTLGEPSPILGPAAATDEVPNPPEWAIAGPSEGGEDGDLYVEWKKCTAIDHAGTRVWAVTQEITDAVGLNQQNPDIHPLSNSTVLNLERGRVYWVALTCVDESGQHDPANATIIGPVVPTGGVDDGTAPVPIENISAWDTPDDEGGRITVSWNPNGEEDCGWHVILVRPRMVDEDAPTDAFDFSNATIVPDCTTNSTIISDWGGQPIEDNFLYWVTVVACDFWGNCDLGNVTSVEVMSERNLRGSDPPPRVENLSAWDHADDMGEAIDVSWSPSTVGDFSFYIIWASNQPVDDLAAAWARCQDDLNSCGLTRIDFQYPMDSGSEKVEVTVGTALYDGDSVETSNPSVIRPNIPLSVTVTIHDLTTSAFLTRLPTVVVTPIDNRDDIIAPDRLEAPFIRDVPGDNGSAVYVEFIPSTASDIAFYEVYADVVAFTSVGHREPVMIVDRDAIQPLLIESIDGGAPVMAGIPIHIAVVPVDSSGNSHRDQLNVGSGKAYDNSGEDPGGHLPDVDFTVGWNDDGTAIEVEWEILNRTDVRNYRIYVSQQRFENSDEAEMAKGGIIGSFWSLEMVDENTTYDNASHWFVAVSAYDGSVWKHALSSKEVKPFTAPSNVDGDGNDEGESSAGILDLLDLNTVLTILLSMAILTVLLLAFRARRNSRKDEAWQLATAAWGLPQEEGWAEPGLGQDTDLAGTLMPAAAQIKSEQVATPQRPSGLSPKTAEQSTELSPRTSTATSTAPTAASAKLEELASDLFDEPRSDRNVTGDEDLDSLIDDLL